MMIEGKFKWLGLDDPFYQKLPLSRCQQKGGNGDGDTSDYICE